MNRTELTAGCIVTDDIGRILLLRGADGRWDIPAAPVGEAEDPADAAARALREACGLAGTVATSWAALIHDGPEPVRRQVYRLTADDLDRLTAGLPRAHGWFFADNLPGVTPHTARFLRAHAPARPHLPREQWLATTPRSWTCTAAILTAPDGRLLMVKGFDVDTYNFPGGMLDAHEASSEGAERELHEETGLRLPAGPLLAVCWQHPEPGLDHPIVQFFHDFGSHDPEAAQLSCHDKEIVGWAWLRPDELDEAAGPARARLARQVVAARPTGHTAILSVANASGRALGG